MITISYTQAGALRTIEFDATLREAPSGMTTITEHAVEVGANISDHSRPELRKISFDVVVSNTPVKAPKTNTDGITGQITALDLGVATRTVAPRITSGIGFVDALPGVGLVKLIGGNVVTNTVSMQKVNVLNFGDVFMNRVLSVFNELELLRTSTTLIQIDSFLQQYTNMVIRSVDISRGPQDGSAVTISVVATEIRFAESQVVAVSDTGTKKTSKGVQPPKAPTPQIKQSTLDKSGVAIGALTDAAPNVARLH